MCPILPSPLLLSPFVFCFPPLKSLSSLPAVFLNFSPSVSVLDEKTEMLEWNQPHFCSVCMCVCVGVCVCVWAHAWPSRAVKVRLIHWLQLRGAERSAEFNSCLVGLLPLTNADRFAKCLRQTACVWKRNGELGHVFSSLSLFYQANFVHVSNPSRRADCLACFQIIALEVIVW